MARGMGNVEFLKASLRTRWEILDWDRLYPWWRKPAKVRVLMYADSSVRFNGGSFLGLQYVINLLQSRAYYYVDFDVATAHRDGADPSATIAGAKQLTDLDILANMTRSVSRKTQRARAARPFWHLLGGSF